MPEFVITTTGLTRRFKNLVAVDNLNLQVPRGSIYGFLGPNGAGKTTTIRMLLGLIRPHTGQARLFDQPMPQKRLALLRRVGALVEAPSLYPHLTGRENLEVTRRLIGGRRQRIDEVLRIVRLEDDAHRKVRGYSNGMRQRLGLALALLAEPELLILDEPTNGLDPAGIREMREFILRLPEEQAITVFLSSHLLSEVEQMATHIGIIQKGRLIFQGTQNDLQSQLADHLALAVDSPADAEHILTQAGWTVQRNGSNKLYVPVNGQSDVAMINSQLNGGGVNVFYVSLERPSLEDIFMNLTGEAEG